MTVEPGRQLAGRYRVEDLLAERAGARLWRAVDEVLRRSVAVDVLPSDSPRASAMVQAARRAAVVTDGRFLRVLDAAEENGDVYVVREWAPGESLDLVLADGPLTHRRAAWIVHEVAEAVSVAHSAGIYHLRLTPENVLVTDTGGVKIIGLATDAALHGVKHADAEAEDVRALGRLLYASLVARWPSGPATSLPAAPVEHGRTMRPAQVRAGVPREVDEVCDRILGEPPQYKAEPLRHASAVAAELSDTVRLATDAPVHDPEATQAASFPAVEQGHEPTGRLNIPDQVVAPPRSLHPAPGGRSAATAGTGRHDTWWTNDATPTQRTAGGAGGGGSESTRRIPTTTTPIPGTSRSTANGDATSRVSWDDTPPDYPAPDSGRRRRGAMLWVGLVALVAALAAAAFFAGLYSGSGNDDSANPQQTAAPDRDRLQRLPVASVSAFDPFGESGENNDEAPLALDGDPATRWSTLSYEGDPVFGGLKPGLGLVLDLGQSAEVSRAVVDLGGSGTNLQLRAAPPQASTPPSQAGQFRTVARASTASGRTVLTPQQPVSTRFVLVWLTRLPPESGGTYRGFVNEITVEG
jgi:Protein kinase domain